MKQRTGGILIAVAVVAAIAIIGWYRWAHPPEYARLDGLTGFVVILAALCIGILIWGIGWNRGRRRITIAIMAPLAIGFTWLGIYLLRRPDVDPIGALLVGVCAFGCIGVTALVDPRNKK